MIVTILIGLLALAGAAASVHAIRTDGYGRIRTDPTRLP